MLLLSAVRQIYDSGFSSVVEMVDDLEQQIEALTLAQKSPSHNSHLQQTILAQQSEIKRLSETIDNKSKGIFKLYQTGLAFQHKFELRLAKTRQINI